MDYKLSIIIPVFNKLNFTKSALNDLFKLPEDCQIIVVDNGSTDDTAKYLRQIDRKHFGVIRNSENKLFARACNIGYLTAASQNIMFLNNDIRVQKDYDSWVKSIIEACEQGYLVSPTVGHLADDFSFINEDDKLTGKNDYLSGWCLAASRSTLERLRLPNEDCPFSTEFGIFFEDTDLSFRAKLLDPPIPFKVQSVPVTHFGHVTARDLGINQLYSKAKDIFAKKWKVVST